MILECCSKYVDDSGNVSDLDEESRKKFLKVIDSYSRQAIRA